MPTSEKIAALIFVAALLAVYASEILLISIFAYRRLIHRRRLRILRTRFALLVHTLAAIGILCFLYGRFIEPFWIDVNRISIPTEKLREASFRIVQFSDIHCDEKAVNEERLAPLINSLRPDVIVFTGDTLNTPTALPLFKDTMKGLEAGLAKLAVRGNFESRLYMRNLDLYGGTGFQLLDHDTVALKKNGEEIIISGLDCRRPGRLETLLQKVPQDRFSIFLYHYSDLVESLRNLNVDLYLCGHTHGGQVALPVYGAIITLSKFGKKYKGGMYHVGDTILYVNRGIGLESGPAPKVRFFARPEITVFDITPKKNPHH